MPKYKSYIKGMNNDLSQDLLAQYQIVILAVSGVMLKDLIITFCSYSWLAQVYIMNYNV